MPCNGKIINVNVRLDEEPQHLSIASEEDGWLMEMEIDDIAQLDDLLDEKAYLEFLDTIEEH